MVRTLHFNTPIEEAMRTQRAMLPFAGATVDGEESTVYAPLVDSPVRY
ncbi:MAG TPA: hypothetical protein VFQ68_12425 [Streptosporangiaceae bacterium]|nr:hypothetical protein [Streptosporangiaceae bacterium]